MKMQCFKWIYLFLNQFTSKDDFCKLIAGVIFLRKHNDEFNNIALNIAYYRKKAGLTQLQLAELINISRTHMSVIEARNIKTSASLDTIFEIAEVLNVPAYKFLMPKD